MKKSDIFINSIIDSPKRYFVASLVFIFIFLAGLLNFDAWFSNRIWFDESHEVSKSLNIYEEIFHNIDGILIGVERKEKNQVTDNFQEIDSISEEIELVKHIASVESISRASSIETRNDDIFIDALSSFEHSEELNLKISDQSEYFKHLINNDKNFTQILVRLNSGQDLSEEYSKILKDLNSRLSKFSEYNFHLLGSVPSNDAFREMAFQDNLLIPFSAVFILLFLIYFFRSIIIVFLPIVLSIVTINMSLGFMSYCGIEYNNILAAIPGVLLAICLADAIHIISNLFLEFENNSFEDSLRISMRDNLLPTLLTSISTVISFYSISLTEIAPVKHLGWIISFGTMTAWILSFTFLCPLIIFFKKHITSARQMKTFDFMPFVKMVSRFKYMICVVFSILIFISIYASSKLIVDSDPLSYFKETNEFRKSLKYVSDKMKIDRNVDLIVDTGVADGVKDPELLRKVKKVVEYIQKKEKVTNTTSVLDVLERMTEVLGTNKKIPNTPKEVAELLFLYELNSTPELQDELFDSSKRYLKLRIFWKIKNSSESKKEILDIQNFAKSLDIDSFIGGDFIIFINIVDKIVNTLMISLGTAAVFVFLLVLFVFKDFKTALIAMLPNFVPITFAGFLVHINGLFLDIGTSMIATVTLGIAIDDTIHFVTKYVSGMKIYNDTFKAIEHSFKKCSMALIQTTIVLFFGFGVFIFADFLPNHNFGYLTAICILMALITDLFLLPAILFILDKDSKRASKV